MKIGDRCFVHGYVDEIRKDTIIIRNKGGYFGTDPGEVIVENDTAHPNVLDCVSRHAAIDAVKGAVIADEQQYAEDALKALPSAQQKEKQMDLIGISETKMKIVIDNYFKSECNTDTSIRQAFETGFRIGVQKGITLQQEQQKGKWLPIIETNEFGKPYQAGVYCSRCGHETVYEPNFCPECGVDMQGSEQE